MVEFLNTLQSSLDELAAKRKNSYLKTKEILIKELCQLQQKKGFTVSIEFPNLARRNSINPEDLRDQYQKITDSCNELIKTLKKKNSSLHSEIRAFEVINIQEKYSNLLEKSAKIDSQILQRRQELKSLNESLISHQKTCLIELNERKLENQRLNCEDNKEIAELKLDFDKKTQEVTNEIDEIYTEIDKLTQVLKKSEEELEEKTNCIEKLENCYKNLQKKLKDKENGQFYIELKDICTNIEELKQLSNPSSPRKKGKKKEEEARSPRLDSLMQESVNDEKNFEVIHEETEHFGKNLDMPLQYRFAHVSGRFVK